MILKLVLVALAVILLLPLLRRIGRKAPEPRAKSASPSAPPAPAALPESSFTSLMKTVVLLDDNDWGACTFDGVAETWARFAAESVRGFCTIPAGRHRAVTIVDGREAVLDFVLYPGEVFIRRLDRASASWVLADRVTSAREKLEAEGGESGEMSESLIRYRSTMGIARVMSGAVASPAAAFSRADAALAELLDAAARGDGAGDAALLTKATDAGLALVGVPLVLSQLRELTARVADRVLVEERSGRFERGAFLAEIGLAMLPGDPTLLEQLASMHAARGHFSGAIACVREALAREDALDADTRGKLARASEALHVARESLHD